MFVLTLFGLYFSSLCTFSIQVFLDCELLCMHKYTLLHAMWNDSFHTRYMHNITEEKL